MDSPHPSNSTPEGRRSTLADRVRSLRLPDRAGGPGISWLPWFLCIVLALTASFFALRSGQPTKAEEKEAPEADAEVKPEAGEPETPDDSEKESS